MRGDARGIFNASRGSTVIATVVAFIISAIE
jgi:hypothetical protein